MWQEAHFPLPKKSSSPSFGSPRTVFSAPGTFKERTSATRASSSMAGKSKAGMPEAGAPLRIKSRNSWIDLSRSEPFSASAGALSVPRASAPWQPAHRCAYIFVPSVRFGAVVRGVCPSTGVAPKASATIKNLAIRHADECWQKHSTFALIGAFINPRYPPYSLMTKAIANESRCVRLCHSSQTWSVQVRRAHHSILDEEDSRKLLLPRLVRYWHVLAGIGLDCSYTRHVRCQADGMYKGCAGTGQILNAAKHLVFLRSSGHE